MPSVLYSTTCYIKNRLYRLSIDIDNNEQNPVSDSSDFSSSEIVIDSIIPSLTRINIELINNNNKNTKISKTIMLNHLLSVQQTHAISHRNRKNFNNSYDIINTTDTMTPITPVNEQSQQTSYTTLNTTISQLSASQTPIPTPTPKPRRQFSFRRFLSTQSNIDNETNFTSKIGIHINYVDVLNSIRWTVKTLKVELTSEDLATELYMNLNLCLSTLKQRPRHLLAFVNPFGGKGRAASLYERTVLPMFQEANITVKSIHTTRANQARDFVINEDVSDYDGLICVGGDGMFAELCHGLLLRTSREAHLNIDDPKVNIIRPDIRIGIIPAGSTDAVVFGTTGLNDPVTSTLQIIVGETLSIDITTVHNEKGFVRFMATMLAYGFFGDIIHQSDKWRRLGPLRYDLAGFCQFIRNKSYRTELTLTLSPYDSLKITHHPPAGILMNHTNDGITSPIVPDSDQLLNNINQITDGSIQINSSRIIDKIVEPALIFCSRNCKRCAIEEIENSDQSHLPSQIKRVGRYTTINCLNMPGRCAKSKFGMAPFVHLADGTFDLILVKRSWWTGFLRFLWQVANDGRSIEDLPHVERWRVREVHIHPMQTGPKHLGNWACDGELISGNEMLVRVHRRALNLFASGIQFDKVVDYNPIKKKQTKKMFSTSSKSKNKNEHNM